MVLVIIVASVKLIILEMFKLDGPFLNHLDFDLELKQL